MLYVVCCSIAPQKFKIKNILRPFFLPFALCALLYAPLTFSLLPCAFCLMPFAMSLLPFSLPLAPLSFYL